MMVDRLPTRGESGSGVGLKPDLRVVHHRSGDL